MAANPTSKNRNVLDKGTLIPLSVAAGAFLSLFAGWQYLDTRFDEIGDKLSIQERRMERMEDSMQRGILDRWTYVDMRLWVSKAQRQNPTLNLPDANR